MKKLLAMLLASVMVLGVAACSAPAEETPADTTTETKETLADGIEYLLALV